MADQQKTRQLIYALWDEMHKNDSTHIPVPDTTIPVPVKVNEAVLELIDFVLSNDDYNIRLSIKERLFTSTWDNQFMINITTRIIVNLEALRFIVKDSFMPLLQRKILQLLVDDYIALLFTHKHSFKLDNRTISKIHQDIVSLENTFEHGLHLPKHIVAEHTKVLGDLTNLLDAEPEYIPLQFRTLILHNPDFTLPMLEYLLGLRADITKDALSSVLESCRRLYNEVSHNGVTTGIFNRLDLPRQVEAIISRGTQRR